ncbi:hypothetical protein HYW54_00220 [Candidatus Gottesmanbacteria bacterium]|nr:hypothetical protein [Candidatus Gottesmanbacteria bacterium]
MGVKKIIRDSFEFVKDTAKQGAKIPPDLFGGMIEQAIKGPKLTSAQQQQQQVKQQAQMQLQKQGEDFKTKDEEELKKAREKLEQLRRMQAMYATRQEQKLRPYEETIQDKERQKAQEVEAQKKKVSQQLPVMTTKPKRGSLFGFLKRKIKGSEGLVKDTKVG